MSPNDSAVQGAADRALYTRVDRALNFAWRSGATDPRLPAGPFSARWHGLLRVLSPGAHRFFVYAASGDFDLKLHGRPVLHGKPTDARWLATDAIELDFGDHPVELRFRKTGEAARMGLYWSGPQFMLEPLSEQVLLHDPAQSPTDPQDNGRKLVRALRCAACHDIRGEGAPLPAPFLVHVADNVKPEWLSAWVGATPHTPSHATPGAHGGAKTTSPPILEVKFRMPGTGMPEGEARDVLAWLQSTAASRERQPDAPTSGGADQRTAVGASAIADNIRAGERLFFTIGCLACHRVGDLGTSEVLGGGDLSNVAEKRPPEFFARWLEDPARINPSHRMPVFPLSNPQRTQLAAYLSTLGRGDASAPKPTTQKVATPQQVERGRRLLGEYRCTACHDLGSAGNAAAVRPAALRSARLAAGSDWEHACLDEPNSADRRPGYRLRREQREAVKGYLLSLPAESQSSSAAARQGRPRSIDGTKLLLDRNCLACHARGLSEGISVRTQALVEAHPELAPVAAALRRHR